MVIAGFSVQDKLGKVRFFEETFLLADTSMEVVLGMLFLTFSDADIRFAEKELVCWSYTMQRPCLLATRRVEIVDRKGFPIAAVAPRVYYHTVWKG